MTLMQQDQALDILKTGANVFLTGEPGAGKTHTVNRYVRYLKRHGVKPAIVASTGIAATHIGGMTVHSWSGIGIADWLSARHLDRIASTEVLHKRISSATVLIVDEVSMLSAQVLDMVDTVCRTVRRSDAPFGGLQTVLVGDFFQLPPVSRKGQKAEYAFRSNAWRDLDPVICRLEGQYRQNKGAFVELLRAIRAGTVEEEHFSVLKSRFVTREGIPERITKLYSHNADVDKVNEAELEQLPGSPHVFTMRKHGRKSVAEALTRGCLSPEELRLKEGAAVMCTRNHPQEGYMNGSTGIIVGFDEESGAPRVRLTSGREIVMAEAEWAVEENGKQVASIVQYPLRLAWAMTIHKSQGMSLDAALMDLSRTFEYGQGYVALSRLRSLEGLHLLGCNRRALEVHPEILEEDRRFRDASLGAEQAVDLSDAEKKRLHEAFIEAAGGSLEEVRPESHVEKARSAHPQAYKKWTDQEEMKLRTAFEGGASTKEMAAAHGRQPGGIRSRLRKLGLID